MRKANHGHFGPGAEPDPGGAAAPPPRARLRAVPPPERGPRPPRPGESAARLEPGREVSAADAYLSALRPSGARSMRSRLDRAASLLLAGADASTFPWGTLRYRDVVYVRARLRSDGASDSTVNLTLSALRRTAAAARCLGQLGRADELEIGDVRGARAERLPKGRMLEAPERAALFEACARDPSPAGRRDAALLALGLGAGLRREEIAALPASAFDARRRELRLVGKGGKEAVLPLQEPAARALGDWLAARGFAGGPLLAPVSRSGRVTGARPLSEQGVYRAVVKRAREAGIAPATPHDLRRTYISELLDVADGETARRLARHAKSETTGIYDRRGEGAGRRAAELLDIPYRGPLARPRPKRQPRGRRRRRGGVNRVFRPPPSALRTPPGGEGPGGA